MSFKSCKKCGNEIPETAEVCPHCGESCPKEAVASTSPEQEEKPTKFCQHCGRVIDKDCVVCPHCGKQVELLAQAQPSIVINNTNSTANTPPEVQSREKNKWISFLLCFFLGIFGAHKFYEGKIGMGILYIFTVGLFGIGALVDLIVILTKPNPYYV